jgi:hypothetical protein
MTSIRHYIPLSAARLFFQPEHEFLHYSAWSARLDSGCDADHETVTKVPRPRVAVGSLFAEE